MSLHSLLEAARIIEEQEYGAKKERKSTRRSLTYRATHNQLEKNRRAHLRDCLSSLRELVPSPPDQCKVTTLSLLQSAKQYIKVLEMHDRDAQCIKRSLFQEQQKLRKRVGELLNCTSASVVVPMKVKKLDCSDDLNIENDDETGYGSGDDSSLSSSGSAH